MSDERAQLESLFYLYARLNLAPDARVVVDYRPDDDVWGAGVYSKGRFLGQLVAREVAGQWRIWPTRPKASRHG